MMNQNTMTGQAATTDTHLTSVSGPGSQYVKLNVGGSLFYTTIATLTKHVSLLKGRLGLGF